MKKLWVQASKAKEATSQESGTAPT
jgi:hypothetical protein